MIDAASFFSGRARPEVRSFGNVPYCAQKWYDIPEGFSYKMIHCVKLLFTPDEEFKKGLLIIQKSIGKHFL